MIPNVTFSDKGLSPDDGSLSFNSIIIFSFGSWIRSSIDDIVSVVTVSPAGIVTKSDLSDEKSTSFSAEKFCPS